MRYKEPSTSTIEKNCITPRRFFPNFQGSSDLVSNLSLVKNVFLLGFIRLQNLL